jgi:hypothetical protein
MMTVLLRYLDPETRDPLQIRCTRRFDIRRSRRQKLHRGTWRHRRDRFILMPVQEAFDRHKDERDPCDDSLTSGDQAWRHRRWAFS